MHTKIQKWGNSQGLRIPKVVLDEIQSSIGDEVEVYSQEGKSSSNRSNESEVKLA